MRSVPTILAVISVLTAVAAAQGQLPQENGNSAQRQAAGPGYVGYITDAPESAAEPAAGNVVRFAQERPLPAAEPEPEEIAEVEPAEEPIGGGSKWAGPSPFQPFGFLNDSWVTLEYIHTWARGRRLPPLVTTGIGNNGLLGTLPGATVLFGDDYVGTDLQSAGKLSFGTWLDPCHRVSVIGTFFAIEGDDTTYTASGDGTANSPILVRPFYDTNPLVNQPNGLVIANPPSVGPARSGSVQAAADNEVLGAEALVRYCVYQSGHRRVDSIVGYRFTRVDDGLVINSDVTSAPNTYTFEDVFDAHNEFHGATVGISSRVDRGPLILSMTGKLSFGNMRETLTIAGNQTVNGVPFADHGLLVQPTNAGEYRHDDFEILPEAEIKLTWRVNCSLDFSIGYSFLYWSGVALAADQIDQSQGNQPTVNSSQIFGALVGPGNPSFSKIRDTDFWLHNLSLGITLKR